MKVVVTGIAGLMGSHVATRLVESGHEVIGVDNFVGGYRENVPDGVRLVEVDGRNLEAMTLALSGADAVFHAACTAYEGLSVFSPHLVTSNTFGLTVSVATAAVAARVPRFVHCSSMARYGTQVETPFREEMSPKPQDPYGIAKLAAEQVLWNLAEVHGLAVTVLVPHNVYGPGQAYDDPYRNVASIMINRILHGRSPIVYGDGSQVRCFSHIDDVLEPIEKVLLKDVAVGEVVNIGPDEGEVSVLHLAAKISEIMEWHQDPIFMPGRPQEVHHATCSADKARRLLGYSAVVDLDRGLASLVDWIRRQPRREFRYAFPLEIRSERVPATWSQRLM